MLDLTVADRAAALLKERGDTVAVAEGAAGGLISAALLAVPGASKYYVGGSVIYTRTAKEGLLGDVLETPKGIRGATEQWATWLATAARTRLGTTWGIGEGGAAGPDRVTTRHLLTGVDDRPSNMIAFATAAIELLTECLED